MKRIITVKKGKSGRWYWKGPKRYEGYSVGYDNAEHAMRDAWTWCGGDVPCLVYT